MPDKRPNKTIDLLKEIKELDKKPVWSLVCWFFVGMALTILGIGWIYLVYKEDPASIKMTTTLPIFLITLGIGILREAYRDS